MVKIILDTDICGDCDDVAAISLLNYFHNRQQAKILAITDCVKEDFGAPCIDGICRYYGNSNIDIGVCDKKKEGMGRSLYTEDICKKFGGGKAESDDYPEAYKLIRKKLSENKNVKLVFIGFLNNLAQLIESPADEISPLTGLELIDYSVEEIVIMGGIVGGKSYNFEGKVYDKEYNVALDILSAQTAFFKLKKEITLVEFELGYKVLAFENIVAAEKDSPIKTAFTDFLVDKRESWDPIAVMYAVLGTNGLYEFSDKGKIVVTDEGKTIFEKAEDGNVRYLIEKVSKEQIVEVLNSFEL